MPNPEKMDSGLEARSIAFGQGLALEIYREVRELPGYDIHPGEVVARYVVHNSRRAGDPAIPIDEEVAVRALLEADSQPLKKLRFKK